MKDMCIHSCYLNKTVKCECRPMKIPEVAAKSSEAKAALAAGYVFWQARSAALSPKLATFAPGIFQSVTAHISEGLQVAEVIMNGL